MKYPFYGRISRSDNSSFGSAKTVNDCIRSYPSLAFKDYNVFEEGASNQYIKGFLKRSFDLVVSSITLITGFPFFAFLVIITKITSTGTVFFQQQRIGKNGRPFYIYKFRSMYIGAENSGPQLAKENDPRVTGWGRIMRKTRLDELPQFVNVFLGHMSIVGPRPERPFFIEQIIEKAPEYKRLLSIKPGITSIGQVKYGYAENVEQMIERMKLDLLYLDDQNLSTDLAIILETVRVIAQGKGK
ncbi:sugar transferase [Segetibacter koreensis]|uniref:sugar transferase n=1 Tax=Segetibacter koreensis TaxID=398037 RepID=UPI00037E8C2D|nr:sugar transferase [Segetibacter koreensis]